MDNPPESFRLLTEDEFRALTTDGRVAYLRRAMEFRNRINRQIDAELAKALPPDPKTEK
jgi:hypothetical protein